MITILHQHGHGHSHQDMSGKGGHSEARDRHQSKNINVRAAFIHVLGDFIQSIGVVIAGYIIWFKVCIHT